MLLTTDEMGDERRDLRSEFPAIDLDPLLHLFRTPHLSKISSNGNCKSPERILDHDDDVKNGSGPKLVSMNNWKWTVHKNRISELSAEICRFLGKRVLSLCVDSQTIER